MIVMRFGRCLECLLASALVVGAAPALAQPAEEDTAVEGQAEPAPDREERQPEPTSDSEEPPHTAAEAKRRGKPPPATREDATPQAVAEAERDASERTPVGVLDDEPDDDTRGFRLGLRAAFGLPVGQARVGRSLSDGIVGQGAFVFDLVYELTPRVHVGLYGQYGRLLTSDCPSETTCTGHDLRFGFQAHYHLIPRGPADPWFGLGFGYELLEETQVQGGTSELRSLQGVELIGIQAGLDLGYAKRFRFGPYLSASAGQFTREVDSTGAHALAEPETHWWLMAGVRGLFLF